jgi:2-dehydropantoate 2-reductase
MAMFSPASKIGVIGAGAIGGVSAALLARAGYQVEIVCKYPELANKIRQTGLHLFGAKGEMTVPMPAVAHIAELSGPKDIVLHVTKATDMIQAARELLPFLHGHSVVISLQNGLCEEALAEVVGRSRTIGCVVGWGATMHAPGELEMTSGGEFIIGNIDQQPDERLPELQKILSAVVPVQISSNIIGHLYAKLIINSCITSLGAICGLYLGEMLARPAIRDLFLDIMREAMAVAAGMNITVEPMNRLDYRRFLQGNSWFSHFRRHALIRLIGLKYRRLKSSSLQSLERGNPTEIDFFNGFIAASGQKHGVPTPVNDWVVQTIKAIEVGKLSISPNNFASAPRRS